MIEGLTPAGIVGLRAVAENSQTASEAVAAPGSREIQNGPARLGSSGSVKESPGELARAAEEFESILLAQILRMVREAGSGGWLGSDDKQGVNPAMDLAETELARALARGSALGISKLLVKEAAQNALPQTSPPQTLRDEAGVPAARSPEESSKAGPVEGGR